VKEFACKLVPDSDLNWPPFYEASSKTAALIRTDQDNGKPQRRVFRLFLQSPKKLLSKRSGITNRLTVLWGERAGRTGKIQVGVKNSSVTGALRVLANKGLVNYIPYKVITLTTEGRRISEDIVQRHNVLRDFFVDVLLLKTGVADRVACTMEHGLSAEILDRLTWFLKYLKQRPECLEDFHREWQDAADVESK